MRFKKKLLLQLLDDFKCTSVTKLIGIQNNQKYKKSRFDKGILALLPNK